MAASPSMLALLPRTGPVYTPSGYDVGPSAGSSVRIERLTTDQKVGGSNPSRRTPFPNVGGSVLLRFDLFADPQQLWLADDACPFHSLAERRVTQERARRL